MAADVEIVGTFTDNASSGLSNLGNIVTGIKSAFDLAGMAIDAAIGFIQPFVDSASESEQAIARLEGVLRATGGAAGIGSIELQEMANGLQEVTRFSDETILNGEALLLTFRNIGEESFMRAVPAMADMAEIFGSVDSAAMQLGKALNDPVTGMGALSRAGITFSEDQKKAIEAFVKTNDLASAQNIILSEVEAQVSGLAETMGNTFAGQMEIVRNKFDTVKETIGGAFLPILGDLLDKVEDAIPSIQVFAEAFATAMSTGDFSALFAVFEDGSSYLGGFIEMLGIAEEQAYTFADAIIQLITNFDFAPLGEAILDFVSGIDWEGLSTKIVDGIDSIDWGLVGNRIAEGLGYLAIIIGEVLSRVDWSALLNSFANAFVDVIGGLFGFVDWEDMINSAEVGFRFVGQAIVDGLVFGIQSTWNSLSSYFLTNWYDFVKLVKDFLGIASPSSVFANIARDIIGGLISGWNSAWDMLIDLATASLQGFLDLFGIDLSGILGGGTSASGLGTAGGGTSTGGTTGGTGSVVNNFYGPVYFGDMSSIGYDCPSPHPLVASSGNQLVTTGF